MGLLPREEKFFELFHAQATLVYEAAKVLHEATRKGPASYEAAAERIEEFEKEGDRLIVQLFTKLNQTFITPLDPEDIHQLGTHLDNVLDLLEDAAHRLYDYEIGDAPPAVRDLCGIIERCADALQKAFDAMGKQQDIQRFTGMVDTLEEEGDRIHRRSVAELFRSGAKAIEVIKMKEILDLLEATTDACEDVSDVLKTVAVKNS